MIVYTPYDQRIVMDTLRHLFTSPDAQLANLRSWNKRRKWGFTEDDFAQLDEPPNWPRTQLQAVVLTPYLSTVQQTFDELCWISGYFGTGVTGRSVHAGSSTSKLRLLTGIEHRRGLAWRKVDLGVNRRRSAFDVRDARTAPHAEVLAAAAHFPDWIRAMDGDKVPYIRIPGYEYSFWPGIWNHSIVIGWGKDRKWQASGKPLITSEHACESDEQHAVAEFPIRHLTYKAKTAPYR